MGWAFIAAPLFLLLVLGLQVWQQVQAALLAALG